MRKTVILVSFLLAAGCSAYMVSSGGAGAQHGKDDRPASVVASDSAITSKIRGKYATDSVVSVFNIYVRTYKGTVTLGGTVGSYVARDRAAELAKDTGGVIAVNNQIIIEDRTQ
jgi:hyperosmotically inducible protein